MEEEIVPNFIMKKNKLGHGSFGDVYLGKNTKTGEKVAIKVEAPGRKKILKHEYGVYQDLEGLPHGPHIPKIYYFGKNNGKTIMIMEFLQASLDKLHVKCDKVFSLKTTLMIGIQIFDLLKKLHDANYIHRDIKPDNFLLGNDDKTRIFIIDFGLTKKFKNGNNVHVKWVDGKSLVGTARYASINCHVGIELSRRDDLESLFYMLVYFFKGELPWQGIEAETREEKYRLIGEKKQSIPPVDLCAGMPSCFTTALTYITHLGFKDKPDYAYIRKLLTDAFRQLGYAYDCKYDWVVKK